MPKPRLLVVEDDVAVGQTIVAFLERAGYDVCLAVNADTAVTAARMHGFDLVIVDVVLGIGGDGNDVVEALLAIQPALKVLFMSGYSSPQYGSSSADPVLVKPFEAKELVARVEQLLGTADS